MRNSAILRHLPNLLTALRLAAAPATAWLVAASHFAAAFGLFAFAGASDALDGFLAKRFGLATRLGRYLDPAADKALMLALFVTLAALRFVPGWLAAAIIGRDLLIVAGLGVALAARAPIAVGPLLIGKLSTALQVLYIGAHLGSLAFGYSLGAIVPADAYVLAAVAAASVVSYGVVWVRAMRAIRKAAGGPA
jgi:cardiolipin synthase (CMP-forming)